MVIRRHALFLIILAFVAASRFAILFLSQTHVHSDEAIIGLMGKHIAEGRYVPFYMYGQSYNAGAAWEAYLASFLFAIFGVGVIPLKAGIVILSLVGVVLFYRMCNVAYDRRTAIFATLTFAVAPSLLKWHFQVRGYSWYFLAIPILCALFFSIQSSPAPKIRTLFLFGLVSGLSIWCLELSTALVVALWLLLIVKGRVSLWNVAISAIGVLIGYAPAIVFNLTHHFANWHTVIAYKTGGSLPQLLHLSTYVEIFFHEMPKFFGPDTILLYYPDTPFSGVVFYIIALAAGAVAIWPFVRSPSKIIRALSGRSVERQEQADFVMIVLILACFIPYLTVPLATPSYFLTGSFFTSVLAGRMVQRNLSSSVPLIRLFGLIVIVTILGTGLGVMADVARQDQIETLISCPNQKGFCMARIPGADIEKVERQLSRDHIRSVWTTVSFVYPLIFESGEKLAVSNAIFSRDRRIYPDEIPRRNPDLNQDAAFVIETGSRFQTEIEAHCLRLTGAQPVVSDCGKLVVIQQASPFKVGR